MATDAVAALFLKSYSDGLMPWETILQMYENDDFNEWLNIQRMHGEIKNDDSTVLIIEFSTL